MEFNNVLGVKISSEKERKRRRFVTWGIILTGLVAVIIIVITFYSYYAGMFTMMVDKDAGRKGIILSDNPEFNNSSPRLYADARIDIRDLTYTDIEEILPVITVVNGDYKDTQNGLPEFLAYTFYIKNNGKDIVDILYYINILESTNNMDAAVRFLLIESDVEGKNKTASFYMKEEFYDGMPVSELPDYSLMPEAVFYETERRIVTKKIHNLQPEQIRKFTVLCWLEGEDPDTVDTGAQSVLNGKIKFDMTFTIDQSGVS